MSRFVFNDLLIEKDGLIKGPFGGDIKKSLFVPKSNTTYKVYEQGIVLNKNVNYGDYYISEEHFKKSLSRFEVIPGDILMTGAGTLGELFEVPINNPKGVINQALLRIRLNESVVNRTYFMYFFKFFIKATISCINGDSVIPNLPPLTIIKSVPVDIPDLPIQRQIAAVLSALDDKIECNNRINGELEAMAKTMYNYWFVQFDFPDGNGKPYKSSGGNMVYNDVIKREIPEGWDVKKIDYFADIVDPHPSHRAPKEVEVGFPFAGIGDIDVFGNIDLNKARVIDEEFVLKQEKDYSINEYSLGYGRVGTVGRVVKLRKQDFRYALSPTMAIINPKSNQFPAFVYHSVKNPIFFQWVKKYTSGSTRPAIGIQHLRTIPVLKPESSLNLIEKFELIGVKLLAKSEALNKQNQQLSGLRGWLLPMLMNGQVTVGKASEKVEHALSMVAEEETEYIPN